MQAFNTAASNHGSHFGVLHKSLVVDMQFLILALSSSREARFTLLYNVFLSDMSEVQFEQNFEV